MVKVKEEMVKIQKFFNECPQCGREDEIPFRYSKDVICEKCKKLNKMREHEARIAKYRGMFEHLNKHFPNAFTFDEHASGVENACILTDEFELESDGVKFIFIIYDDGMHFLKLSKIMEVKDSRINKV